MVLKLATELIIPERKLGWLFFLGAQAPAGDPLFRRLELWERLQLSLGIRCPNADKSAYVLSNPANRIRCEFDGLRPLPSR